jgi:hypothetical protein
VSFGKPTWEPLIYGTLSVLGRSTLSTFPSRDFPLRGLRNPADEGQVHAAGGATYRAIQGSEEGRFFEKIFWGRLEQRCIMSREVCHDEI